MVAAEWQPHYALKQTGAASPAEHVAAAVRPRPLLNAEKGELLAQLQATGAGIAIAIEDETGWRTKEVMLGGL